MWFGRRQPATSAYEPEGGFTLIELMVVILILAILVAIGLASLLGARTRAQDAAARSHARQALGTAKTIFQVDENYLAATITALSDAEPALRFVASTQESTGPDVASVGALDAQRIVIAVYSRTGSCNYIKDEAVGSAGGTRYAAVEETSADCTADSPPDDAEFGSKW